MPLLTATGIGAAIVAALGSFKEIISGAVKVIVIAASIAFALVFAAAIISLISMLANVVATSVVGEFYGIVSMCLPFDVSFVFGNFLLLFDGVILFLIAKKTYELIGRLMYFAA